MREIAEYVAGRADWSFDVVCHVGAGTGAELATYRRMDAGRVVLVEANPELAAPLRRRVEGMRGVEVVALGVAARAGEGLLHLFNNPRESSLHAPTGLLQQFPNLQPAKSVPVPTAALEDLLRDIAADGARGNLLVIDVVGIDLAALDDCAHALLHAWSHVAVRTAAVPLYEGTPDEAALRGCLERAGYRQLHEAGDTVAPFRELLFVRDDAAVDALRLADAAAELAALRARHAQQERELEEARALAASERAQHAAERFGLAELARRTQDELERRALLERERTDRLRSLTQEALSRAGLGSAASDAPVADIEAVLRHCLDRLASAWDEQASRLAGASEAADAAQRALRDLEAECARRAEHERTLCAALASAAAEREALALDVQRRDTHQARLDVEMVRAQAQIGLIRDLLLREAEG